jgi:hypothetical protein
MWQSDGRRADYAHRPWTPEINISWRSGEFSPTRIPAADFHGFAALVFFLFISLFLTWSGLTSPLVI